MILLALSAALMAVNVVLAHASEGLCLGPVLRGRASWSLLAYLVIGGMIEFVFVRNHVRGGTLVVLTLSLLVFAIHVPTLIGFTVARYSDS